jgi:hypothetical protein
MSKKISRKLKKAERALAKASKVAAKAEKKRDAILLHEKARADKKLAKRDATDAQPASAPRAAVAKRAASKPAAKPAASRPPATKPAASKPASKPATSAPTAIVLTTPRILFHPACRSALLCRYRRVPAAAPDGALARSDRDRGHNTPATRRHRAHATTTHMHNGSVTLQSH